MTTTMMNQRCDILLLTPGTKSTEGRATKTQTNLHTGLRCRFDSLRVRSRELDTVNQPQETRRGIIYVEYKSDITNANRILLNEETFHIVAINSINYNGSAGFSHLEIEVVTVKNA